MSLPRFSIRLNRWYEQNARDLPWRRTRDPYKIWISEVMLQQTTVATVIPYFEKWVIQYPTIRAVAKAAPETILKSWQGLGYYARAKNIQKAAQIIVRDFAGQFPEQQTILEKLPGFGPYTTGAVLSIAFDQRVPIIDANVRRVLMRQLGFEGAANGTHDKKITATLLEIMPLKGNRIFNQALMELGALICRSRQPLCLACPVRSTCRAYSLGKQEIIPLPKIKVLKNISVAVAVIKKADKIFLQKRPSHGLLADLWELPGGKLETGEAPLKALKRELKEELNCSVLTAKHLFDLQHFYTQFRVRLHVFQVTTRVLLEQDKYHKWVSFKNLQNYPLPSGTARILSKL